MRHATCERPFSSPAVCSASYDRHGRRVLHAQEIARYRQEGFLSIPAVASPSDIAEVRRIIDAIYAQNGRTCGSIEHLMQLAPELRATRLFGSCLGIAKQLLGRTTMYACDGGLYKEPHGKHGTPWHQDGAFHGKYFPNPSISFWIPLQAVSIENGCMHYIPLQKRQVLLPHRPYYSNDNRSMMTDCVDDTLAVVCPLQTGDITVHGPLTLHSAHANSTDDIRRTWLLTFRPWGKWGFFAPSRLASRSSDIMNLLVSQLTSSQRSPFSKG